MRLSKPAVGWIFWEFPDAPEPFDIGISNIFNSLETIWIWALELAHGFLPCSLNIDEEGCVLELTAASAGRDELLLTARRLDEQRETVSASLRSRVLPPSARRDQQVHELCGRDLCSPRAEDGAVPCERT